MKFPMVLAQGAEGIAVGLSTKILPHNFIELIKANRKLEAVQHARKYLAIEDADQLSRVQKACALLAFPADWLMRLRHNPFYDYLERRALGWVQEAGGAQGTGDGAAEAAD